MANTLRFKRGLVSTIPTALAGEPLFTTDTFDLYIGNGTTNTRFQKYIASGTTSQLLRGDGSLLTMPIVLTSPSNGQVLKYNGTSWVNDSDAGITGSGTTNYLPKFTGASTLGNSILYDNGSNAIGLAVVPSAWGSTFRAMQIGGGASFYGITDPRYAIMGANSFYNGTADTYMTTGVASLYVQALGSHLWYNAPSGTINTPITYTERARITAGGNFIINNPSTDNGLRFQVTGDGYFSGSVGIGGTPTTKLTVSGGYANFTDGTVNIYVGSDGTGGLFGTITNQYLRFITNNTERMRLDASGNLGIGTSTLTAGIPLTINAPTGANTNIAFQQNSVDKWYIRNITGTDDFSFYSVVGAAERMRLTSGGNLGLGTSTINVSALGRAITISSANSGLELTSATNVVQGTVQSNSNGLTLEGIGTAGMRFFTSASGATTERMRLDASGNLGLGVVPSAWGSPFVAFQISTGGAALIGRTDGQQVNLSTNWRFASGTNFYIANGFASRYAQESGGHYWYTAPNNTSGAGAALPFTQAMTLDASGRLGIGTISPLYKLQVYNSGNGTTAAFGGTARGLRIDNDGTFSSGRTSIFGVDNTFYASFQPLSIEASSLTLQSLSGGNVLVGTTTDAGYKLDVNGTMRVSGASTFSSTITASSNIVGETGFRTKSLNGYAIWNDLNTAFLGGLVKKKYWFGGADESPVLVAETGYTLGFYVDGSSTKGLSLATSGAATFSSSVTAGGRTILAAGYIADLSGSGNDIGIVFSSSGILSSTGAGALAAKNLGSSANPWGNLWAGAATFSSTAQAAGFITSGGAGYAVINSASNTVTALRPTGGGASIMSTNSNGLHIAVGTQAAGDLILASNNTERIRLSSNGFFSQLNATNPSASITDSYIQYSADVVAGNAAPHFRTENGSVIKLYQETTGVGNSIISLGGGNAVLDDTTFDGYTLRQIVKALRNQGILA